MGGKLTRAPSLVERLEAAALAGWSYDVYLLEPDAAAAVAEAHYADALEAQQALADRYEKALREAAAALSEHACHLGPGIPCARSADQCAAECGRSAGDAMLVVSQALSSSQGRHEGGGREPRTRHKSSRRLPARRSAQGPEGPHDPFSAGILGSSSRRVDWRKSVGPLHRRRCRRSGGCASGVVAVGARIA